MNTHPLPPRPVDPPVASNFLVEIDGLATASFASCSGLGWRVRAERFHEGGRNDCDVALIAHARYEPVVLRRGLAPSDGALAAWLRAQMDPSKPLEPRTVSIVLAGDDGTELARFTLHDAWCSAYRGPHLDAGQAALSIEEIELTYAYFDYEPRPAPSTPSSPEPFDRSSLPPGVLT